MEYVCEIADARRVALRQEWTDRGPEPVAGQRLSVEGLAALRALVDALTHDCSVHAGRDG